MEKELKYTIEDDAIAELFGRQNFSTKESAIFELIKNSFDSGATECRVILDENNILLIDNGDGMSSDTIEKRWMHVGKSQKGYYDEKHGRVLAGSKGVGRFALARLGNKIELTTSTGEGRGTIWKTDWLKSLISTSEVTLSKGTTIEIYDLREKFREKDFNKLYKFLIRAYNSKDMKLFIEWKSDTREIVPIYDSFILGKDYASKILLSYNSNSTELSIEVISDEFKNEVIPIIAPLSSEKFDKVLNMYYELATTDMEDSDKLDLKKTLENLGSFSAELFFGLSTTSIDAERFRYKHPKLAKESPIGVILYRNNFSISSFEGTKDWLDISSRARKSPAAATHKTGTWRVRANQLDGFVLIDKKNNDHLTDLSNRQGLDENDYYEVFVKIISSGLSEFERYRQGIIRKIDEYNHVQKESESEEPSTLSQFLKKPEKATEMSKSDFQEIAKDIQKMQEKQREKKEESKEYEEKLKYENRILNVLATQGLRASSVAHEFHTKNNAVGSTTTYIIEALREYGYWDDLNSYEKTKKQYKNIPKLLEQNEEINLLIGRFMEAMLKRVEKKNFSKPAKSISNSIDGIVEVWDQGYSWVHIKTDIEEQVNGSSVYLDSLTIIFDNLILNSIQHNEEMEDLNISIKVKNVGSVYYVTYSDDGRGLPTKYLKEPMKILEAHETSRSEGHGLGMWMLNSTLDRNDGEVTSISGDDGFKIEFYFGGKSDD